MSDPQPLRLCDVGPADLDAILALNEASVPHVSRVPVEQFDWFREHAAYFRVLDDGTDVVGFLVALTREAPYGSPNFRWFVHRDVPFMYVDRIVIAEPLRGRGLGRRFYADLEECSRGLAAITCEVNIRPVNDGSLLFHERLGFVRVGTQETEGGTKEVALLQKAISDEATERRSDEGEGT